MYNYGILLADYISQECLEAFEQGDKQNAERLLPQLRSAKACRIRALTVMVNGVKITIASQSSLLHLAATHGWMDFVIDLITKYKCDANCKNSKGSTPLHYAFAAGHLEVVRYFINEQHCDLMTKTNFNQTPLHCACKHDHANIVQYLLSTGKVDPLAKDDDGKTPMYYAGVRGNYDLLKLFRSFSQLQDRELERPPHFHISVYTKLVLTGYSGAGKPHHISTACRSLS